MLLNSCDFIGFVSSYFIYYVRKGKLEFSFYPQGCMETVKISVKSRIYMTFTCNIRTAFSLSRKQVPQPVNSDPEL